MEEVETLFHWQTSSLMLDGKTPFAGTKPDPGLQDILTMAYVHSNSKFWHELQLELSPIQQAPFSTCATKTRREIELRGPS